MVTRGVLFRPEPSFTNRSFQSSVWPLYRPTTTHALLPRSMLSRSNLKTSFTDRANRFANVYSPGSGFCSLLTVLEGGDMVEIATIGNEGMVGVSAMFDGSPVTSLAMVQGETDLSAIACP